MTTSSAINKKRKQSLVALISIAFLGLALLISYRISSVLAPDSSSALLGGVLETGYPAAGFLVAYANQTQSTCGYTAVGPNTAVTAAHCVDGANRIYLGSGEFNLNHDSHIQVIRARQQEGWIENRAREEDIAVLNFNNPGLINAFADIGTPVEGCKYKVVAYGRTEDAGSTAKPRKSGVLCASIILDNVMYMTGRDAGICFGDSGSAVFFADTNTLVGVVASIVKPLDAAAGDDPCQVDNTAIVVRTDKNLNLINNTAKEFNPTSSEVKIDDALVIDVAERNGSILPTFTEIVTNPIAHWQLIAIAVILLLIVILSLGYLLL